METNPVPLMVSVCAAEPTSAEVGEIPVMFGTGLLIVNVSVAFPVPALFVALSVTVEVPAVVGVPEINPVLLFTPSPAGKPVAP